MQPNRMILDMPPDAYHAHPALSKSGMDALAQSPMHYKWRREHPEDMTDALRIGQAFHTLLLEPELFDDRVAIWSGLPRNTKAGKDDYEKAITANPGKLLIKRAEHENMQGMAKAILAHPAAKIVLEGKGKVEPSLFWTDPGTGVECRARPDWLREDGLLVDLKTTVNAHPEAFGKNAGNFHYHLQAAHYCEGYYRVTGKYAAGFVFIAVEKEAPFGVSVQEITAEDLMLGEREVHKLLERFADCQRTDSWPGYATTIEKLKLPAWIARQANQGENTHV